MPILFLKGLSSGYVILYTIIPSPFTAGCLRMFLQPVIKVIIIRNDISVVCFIRNYSICFYKNVLFISYLYSINNAHQTEIPAHHTVVSSHHTVVLSHDTVVLSHDTVVLSHDTVVLSHDTVVLSHHTVVLSHHTVV